VSENAKLDPATLSATVREMYPPPTPLVGWLGFYYDSSKDAPEDAGWYCSGKVHPDREEALCELAGFRPFEGSALVEVGQAGDMFAPATEKAVCPNCKEETGENHVSSYNRDSFTCQPATEREEVMLSERDSLHIPTMRQTEDARRLARYDEAVRLLRRINDGMQWNSTPNGGHWLVDACALRESEAFLAAEPKEKL